MIAFEKKIPSNTNFCYCSECHICEETSRGIIIIVATIIIIMIIIIIIIIVIIIIIHYHHHCYYCCYCYYYYHYYYYYYHSINNIPYQCDINCAGHFTLDALASRPVACFPCWPVGVFRSNHVVLKFPLTMHTAGNRGGKTSETERILDSNVWSLYRRIF